ncbi:MAG: hypothetical protein E7605_02860 [Ruminococcaceae bacterium]|nr:hypothetical protein [Oscillospiraceae bacterium]
MDFVENLIKVVIILAMILLMALPFLMEFFTFYLDKSKKISYKRFRIVIYTAVYVVAITIALYFLKGFFSWLESLSFVQWIVTTVGLSHRTVFLGKVLAAVLVNFAVGALYVFCSKFARIGLKKKSLLIPEGEAGQFSRKQKRERKVIKFFHTETWFFVGSIVKWLSIALSCVYALVFIVYMIPAMFPADWIPYDIVAMLFEAGYIYPTISLLALWELYFFLEGIRCIDKECPELLDEGTVGMAKVQEDLKVIDAEVRKQFGDYYICDVDVSGAVQEELSSTDHSPLTEYIAQAVERDKRNPQLRKESYLTCLDKLVESEKGVLINGNFFSEFSMYFLRYISAVIARGDNVVFVCNTDAQIDSVYDYLTQGFSEISSLYCKGFQNDSVDFDDPIWRVVKVRGEQSAIEEAAVDENNVLVTSLTYLCSTRFETEHSKFISLIDAVVFVDSLATVNTHNRQLAIVNTRLKHIIKKNSIAVKNGKSKDLFRVRYVSRDIRYICFDDTRSPGLDKVLKNMLSVNFETVDAMNYSPTTMVRCYAYEGKPDENGRRHCPQFFNSEEEVGAVMNMAVLCLAKGASNVTVFADNIIPYENIAETIAANRGRVSIQADGSNIRLNKQFYNPNDYSVIIAVDSGDNLPATLRRYISMVSDKPALIIVFSRPYMLRDYYVSNINNLWSAGQMERIPVEEKTGKDVAQRILVKANAGGISRQEILRLATGVPQFDEYATKGDLNAVLREVLRLYGESLKDNMTLFKYFEYVSLQDFDEKGKFNPELRVILRRQGKFFESLNGRDMAVMVVGDREYILSIPRSRLTQNYIAGQNLIYNGNVYYIQKLDFKSGRVYARLAVGGKNEETYQYIQSREYHLAVGADQIEYASTKHIVLKLADEDVSISDVYVSAFKAPMEVVTRGYFAVDSHTLALNSGADSYYSISDPGNDALAKQTYRRYGMIAQPFYSSDSRPSVDLNVKESGALMMSIRICGQFGSDINKTMLLAATMLNEMLRSMFPSVADSIAVCPVLQGEMAGEDVQLILQKQPKIKIIGESELVSTTDFNLVIVEDSATDLGVVAVLMSAGDDVLRTLFSPLFNYLEWYSNTGEKSDYLHFGMDHEPECFDFDALHRLSKLLGDDKHDLRFVDIESVIEYASCDFCGKRYAKGHDMVELDDGRRMCKSCAENLVGNNKKILKSHLDRARMFLESTYGVTLDSDYEFCFESTLKIANTLKQNRMLKKRGTDIPLKSYVDDKKKVHVEYSLPSVNLSELLVRELTHVWQLKHLPDIPEDLAEGHIALVAVQYLRFLNQHSLSASRATYYESTDNLSGEGYRRLVRELLENPQFRNNPFRYLMETSGASFEDEVTPPSPRSFEFTEYSGRPYTPEKPDRALDGSMKYFYYERLTTTGQKAYDTMLAAIQNHETTVTLDGCTFEDAKKISEAIEYDHPELFWYKTFSMRGEEVSLRYGASAEAAAVLQKRIEEVAPKYLEGIDDSMSAYDVAIRLHVKIISSVDYDTIALEKQKKAGGPEDDKIDYLRTICGVFLDGKAVCEGYARAMQYLLQRCGIESAEVAGYIRKENGERDGGHAWNILKIDGDYYYLDTTWDDSSSTVQTVKSEDLGFDYFCITTDELMRTRDLDLCPTDLPGCYATRANYYYHNDAVLETYDINKIKAIAQEAAKEKRKSFTFKCRSRALLEESLSRLCTVGEDCYEAVNAAAKIDKQILPNQCSYARDPNIWTITINFKYKADA